ncbi:MAG: VOC family protein [Alphaproteobacteria bacterium]
MENSINFIEFHVSDIEKSKAFFHGLFGWAYVDYGAQYADITGAGVSGGLALMPKEQIICGKSPLVVFYKSDLEAAQGKVVALGGTITKEIFSFPGGRRFEFTDLDGNALAIWSDK